MENYSLSDIQAATGGMGGFGSEGLWIFALLILMFGGNGFFGNNNGNAARQEDIQRAVDLNAIQNGQRDIESRVQEVGAENISAIKDAAYNNLGEIRDIQSSINTGFANMQNCCCDLKGVVMENRYLDSQNTASINANTTAQTQRILDAIAQNKIDTLQSQLNSVQMQQAIQNAMCGVPKVNPYMYNISPSCGCTSLATV